MKKKKGFIFKVYQTTLTEALELYKKNLFAVQVVLYQMDTTANTVVI